MTAQSKNKGSSKEMSGSSKTTSKTFNHTGLGRLSTSLDGSLEKIRGQIQSSSHPLSSDTIALSPRPRGALIFWHLTSAGIARARTQLSSFDGAQLLLRLYLDGDELSSKVLAFEIERWTDSHLFDSGDHIGRISATIGLKTDSEFVHIVRSAPIPLMRRRAGTGLLRRSGPEKDGLGRMVLTTKKWSPDALPERWQTNRIPSLTMSIAPTIGELDRPRRNHHLKGGGP